MQLNWMSKSQSAQQKVTETSGTDDTNQKSTAPDNASSQVESKEHKLPIF